MSEREVVGHVKLLAQADLLLLAASLLRPPDRRQAIAELTDEDAAALVGASGLPDPGPLADQLCRTVAAFQRDDVALEHDRLFQGAIACPPNESTLVRRDKGAILADVCGFYAAFGFRPREEVGEKPDHIVAELEFAAMLLVAWAGAEAEGRAEEAAVTADALARFAADHLGEWITTFALRLAAAARGPAHEALAQLLADLWGRLAAAHAWRTAEPLPALMDGADRDPLEPDEACGAVAPAPRLVDLTVGGSAGLPVVNERGTCFPQEAPL